MILLHDPGIDAETARGLEAYQNEVNAAGTYGDQVRTAKDRFRRYNRSSNPVFKVVRTQLAEMCSGARRCGYCEDSAGDEIEHIKPKDLYPEAVFAWENYLLSCGQCNRGKNGSFAVISRGRLVDVTRRQGEQVHRPRRGPSALINPRDEDPLTFLELELEDTFMFLPRTELGRTEEVRAEYTIEVLRLNREVLRTARREAYGAYRARLHEYSDLRRGGAENADLQILKDAILTSAHPTVWWEMQYQHGMIEDLRALFAAAPDALTW